MWSIIWLALFVVLIVFEAVTTGLFTIWFAGGALAAFGAGVIGFGLVVQVVVFVVVSGLSALVFCRSWLKYFTARGLVRTSKRTETTTNTEG